ncbi:MAG: hypothetical protein JNM12_01250 [Alphaproteobacteria bacterium]|nr:hypothetical protein [Alphaproteobacteria bacterium]
MTEFEKDLVRGCLRQAGKSEQDFSIDTLEVQEMTDSGTGALYFVADGKTWSGRGFGDDIINYDMYDTVDETGVKISVNLILDKEGRLFELDIFRFDNKLKR